MRQSGLSPSGLSRVRSRIAGGTRVRPDDPRWDLVPTSQHSSRASRWGRLWIPVIVALVVQVPSIFFHWNLGSPPTFVWAPTLFAWLGLALALFGPLTLIGARRFPGQVVAIVAAATSVDLLLFPDAFHAPYIALGFAIVGGIVRGARTWVWVSVAAAWIASLTIAIMASIELSPQRVASATLGILIVMGIGEGMRTRREQFAEYSRRLTERKQSEVQAERVRIARELHDVLAHSLSQINVQAGVGLHLMDRQPDQARAALANIKDTSKTALDEVRAVLGALRSETGAMGEGDAPLLPGADLSRLPTLAVALRAQGISVDIDDSLSTMPTAAAQLALYRIAQESLTNVLRHAQASAVTVKLHEVKGGYRLVVTDDGAGSDGSTRGGGRGLLGMHERAELLGGTLSAEPLVNGGFRVIAMIPAHERPRV